MGGVLTHVVLGLLASGLMYALWRRYEFALAIFIGNVIVDSFKFLAAALYQGTFSFFSVKQDEVFWFFARNTSSFANWLSFAFLLMSLSLFLYHHHIIRKKTMFEYDEVLWFFLLGVIMHLITDILIIESGPWI